MSKRSRVGFLALGAVVLVPVSFAFQDATRIGTRSVDGSVPGDAVIALPPQGSYAGLTDNVVEVTNFMPEVYRGTARDTTGAVWAVNPYASTVGRFEPGATQPDLIVETGHNPVSVAVVPRGMDPSLRDLLVVCVGSHAAFLHDGEDGRVKDVVALGSEPGDVALDLENGWAWVSCQGSNEVLQLDLGNLEVLARHALPGGERPGPLFVDGLANGVPEDNVVYVAATLTGNNSVRVGTTGTVGLVRDLDLFPCCGLPDEDVHRIDPLAGTIEPAIKACGSLLFDVDRHPANGDLWVLSFESNNKDPLLSSEPDLKGKLGINQLKIVAGVSGPGLVAAGAGVDLDDWDPLTRGPQYDAARSMNQARSLAFRAEVDSAGRRAFVCSPLSDLIVALDDAGRRVDEIPLPTGSQCWSLEIDEGAQVLYALCLGTMTVETLNIDPLLDVEYPPKHLGLDPTPDQVRRGRDVFLDGARSRDGRFGCGSCHPGGRADQLGWQLRDDPLDQKDVMVTQSLLSMADTFPHHWRGERSAFDFLGAFVGLLGAPPALEPTQAEMEDFVVFMNSLQAPANPFQNPRRILDDDRAVPAPNGMLGSAVRGQHSFMNIVNFNGSTCAGCHSLPNGADGNFFSENGSNSALAANMEVAHLRQLQHKGLETLELDFGNGPIPFNVNGFGVLHEGRIPSVFDFVFVTPVFLTMNDQQRVDTFEFVRQFDQGISPACHWSVFYALNSPPRTEGSIEEILLAGAVNGWNDVVAFGRRDEGQGLEPQRWLFEARTGLFRSDDSDDPLLTWTQMQAEVRAGAAEYAVCGLPPGNGPRFAIDFDDDGLPNADEVALGADPWRPDTDGDGQRDGLEAAGGGASTSALIIARIDREPPDLVDARLSFSNARLAKMHLVANEDVTFDVVYGTSGGEQYSFARDDFCRVDTFVLTHDEPSTPTFEPIVFDAQVTLTDRSGNRAGPFALPSWRPKEASIMSAPFPLFTHVADLEWVKEERVGTTLDAELRVQVNYNYGAPNWIPAEGRMVFCTIAKWNPDTERFEQSADFDTLLSKTFQIQEDGVPVNYEGDPGSPWLRSELTAPDGSVVIPFTHDDLNPGDVLRVAVMGLIEPLPMEEGGGASGPKPVIYDAMTNFQLTQLRREGTRTIELVF